MSTVIVSAVLAAIAGSIIYKLVKDKKEGRNSCGCGCSSCPMSDNCHKK